MKNSELIARMIAGHELAAIRNPRKRAQHLLAAQLIRERYGIPDPTPLVDPITSANGAAQRAEADRIKQWKESR